MCSSDPVEAAADADEPDETFVEVDPSGRYGRYKEVLGKGASKSVYKAFDKVEGLEVAWYQVHFNLAKPESMDRLYLEVNLLKRMKHQNIIKFYASWIDHDARNVNFITECFTSGTLREYRAKHKKVNVKAVKSWARQILRGLVYMHTHDPPIVHRDLKCDNIFVNGNHGEIKIGDLGLATILREVQACHTVTGTPEFMAPELYDEKYNELVDIYAFGMCILELVTLDYPYSECSSTAQIMRRVIEGIKPKALSKIRDPQIKQFVEKCIAPVSERLSAQQLLLDPFLQCGPEEESSDEVPHSPSSSAPTKPGSAKLTNSSSQGTSTSTSSADVEFKLRGKLMEDGTVSLFLRNKVNGQVRNIDFAFDLNADTAMAVATEMVVELDLSVDVTTIAQTIDAEITSLVPDWKSGGASDAADEDNGKKTEGDKAAPDSADSAFHVGDLTKTSPTTKAEMTAIWVETQDFVKDTRGDYLAAAETPVEDAKDVLGSKVKAEFLEGNYEAGEQKGQEADVPREVGGEQKAPRDTAVSNHTKVKDAGQLDFREKPGTKTLKKTLSWKLWALLSPTIKSAVR